MTEQPSDTPDQDQTEPAGSPQRRLVEQVAAYDVDPPAPERARPEPGRDPG